jgi:hypothetical protein
MKKILFLLLISMIAFSGCKFVGNRASKKASDTLEAYAYNLEQKLAAQEQVHQIRLDQLKQESQARIDSIKSFYESGGASRGGIYGSAASGNFYLIVGSFKTPAYAASWSDKVSDMGYQTEIVKVSDWNLVSAESSTSLGKVLDGLDAARSNVTPGAWIYVAR